MKTNDSMARSPASSPRSRRAAAACSATRAGSGSSTRRPGSARSTCSSTTSRITGVATATGSDYVLRKADTIARHPPDRQRRDAADDEHDAASPTSTRRRRLQQRRHGGRDDPRRRGRRSRPQQGEVPRLQHGDRRRGQVDVYLITAACSTLDGSAAAPTAAGVSGLQSAYVELAVGTAYHLCVTSAGDKSDVRLEIPSFVLSEKRIVTVILARGAGGYLLNAIVLDQQGAATQALNASARARVATSVATAGRRRGERHRDRRRAPVAERRPLCPRPWPDR